MQSQAACLASAWVADPRRHWLQNSGVRPEYRLATCSTPPTSLKTGASASRFGAICSRVIVDYTILMPWPPGPEVTFAHLLAAMGYVLV